MDNEQIAYYMEKRGNLEGLTNEEKDRFIDYCKSQFLFYDPFKNQMINPISLASYHPQTLQRLLNQSEGTLEQKSKGEIPSKEQVDRTIIQFKSRRNRAYNLQTLFGTFKYLGIIVGGLVALFIDFKLGLAIGLFLIHLDFSVFDKVNGVVGYLYSDFMTPLLWQRNRHFFFFGSWVSLVLSLISLYLYSNSFWLALVVFIIQKWVIVHFVVRYIVSWGFVRPDLATQLLKEFEKHNTKSKFGKENSRGIKLKPFDFYNDKLCQYEEVEQLRIRYETAEDKNCFQHLFIYSKKPIQKNVIETALLNDNILDEIIRLESDISVEFYFGYFPNSPKTSYFVIAKEDFYSMYHFEGSYSNNFLKNFYENGNIRDLREYKNGIMDGELKEFHENGTLHFRCLYEHGRLSPGSFIWYYDNGNLMMRGKLRKNGKTFPKSQDLYDPNSKFRDGVWEVFNENGDPIKAVEYSKNGEKKILFDRTDESNDSIWL